jgi:hypothetical protein
MDDVSPRPHGGDATAPGEAVLLEHLASLPWFRQQGEVALTMGLTYCLNKDPNAAEAFVALVHERTAVSRQDRRPNHWQAEWIDQQGRRPDVVGWVRDERHHIPAIFVEAKVWAAFGDRQIADYAANQAHLLSEAGAQSGCLAVLVPADRVDLAREEVARDLGGAASTTGRRWIVRGEATVHIAVMSWEETLAVMANADGSARGDIEQLAGACRAVQGASVGALKATDLAGNWRKRLDDLHAIVDRVTREATVELEGRGLRVSLLPWQPRPSAGLLGGFRYIGEPDQPNLAVGMPSTDVRTVEMRAKGIDPPLWIRWHGATTDASEVQPRLRDRGIDTIRDASGLVWHALRLEPDVGIADRQIAELTAQVVDAFLAGRRPGGLEAT